MLNAEMVADGPKKASKHERLEEALQIRHAALSLVRASGEWRQMRACRHAVLMLDIDTISVWHTTFPFGFGIDVWDDNRKVFNVQWNDSAVDVISFRRGEWEDQLVAEWDRLALRKVPNANLLA